MPRLFCITVTRTDRAMLPAGAAIGHSYLLHAASAEQADRMAAERLRDLPSAGLLFVERVEDVTPPVSRY